MKFAKEPINDSIVLDYVGSEQTSAAAQKRQICFLVGCCYIR